MVCEKNGFELENAEIILDPSLSVLSCNDFYSIRQGKTKFFKYVLFVSFQDLQIIQE